MPRDSAIARRMRRRRRTMRPGWPHRHSAAADSGAAFRAISAVAGGRVWISASDDRKRGCPERAWMVDPSVQPVARMRAMLLEYFGV